MKIAVIPARGGSKRIPGKNVRLFCGKPMIAWSIEAAIQSNCFELVVVSTDDAHIASIAQRYGATVPFMRPESLSDDYTGTVPVIAHAVRWISENIAPVSFACCVYATAPFIAASDIKRGLQALIDKGAEYAFSVTTYAFPIQRAIRINKNGRVTMFHPEYLEARSQDLELAWHDAGQFYWGMAESWKKGIPIFSESSVSVPIPRSRVQDIDTVEDWEHAEYMFKAMQLAAK